MNRLSANSPRLVLTPLGRKRPAVTTKEKRNGSQRILLANFSYPYRHLDTTLGDLVEIVMKDPAATIVADIGSFLATEHEKRVAGLSDLRGHVEKRKIINKQGELVSLILYKHQDRYLDMVLEEWANKRPVRDNILKARQEGFSTLIQAIEYCIIDMWPNVPAYVLAETEEKTQEIFKRTRRFWDETPEGYRRPVIGGVPQRGRIEFAPPWYSQLVVQFARNYRLGRGLTPHFCHNSEYAYWPPGCEDTRLAIQTAMPQPNEHWFTGIFNETTANGANAFRQFWKDSENGTTGYRNVFIPWQEFPFYSIPALRGERLANARYTESTPEIHDYAARFNLSRDRIKWMLATLQGTCDNDLKFFHQEYPASADLAFQTSAHPWFDQNLLTQRRKEITESAV